MSEPETSGVAPVAPAETVSAPSAPAANTAQAPIAAQSPTFGTSRGSGLLRGKRPNAPATKSTDSNSSSSNNSSAASGAYQPTAVQILTSESTYKNPFAPEPAVVAPSEPVAVAAVETAPPAAPVAAAPIAVVSEASPAPQAEIKESAPSDEPVGKAELKILPPEGKSRPAQSWESDSFPASSSQNPPRADQAARSQPQGRRDGARLEDRPIFRTERARERMEQELREGGAGQTRSPEPAREPRESREPRQPRDPREQRQPRDPRDQREPRQPRDPRDQREPRAPREARPFEKAPGTTPPVEAKKAGGFLGWLKNLFAEDTVNPPADKPASEHPTHTQGERRFDGGRGRNQRGGRGGGGGGGGYRGGNGGGGGGYRNNQPRADGGPAPQGEPGQQQHQGGGERRFDGAGGSGHRHRGGRGRGGRGGYRGGNGGGAGGGGEGRSDSSSGPAS